MPYTASVVRGVLVLAVILGIAATVPAQQSGTLVPPLGLRIGLGSGFQNIDFPVDDAPIGTDQLRMSPNTPLYAVLAGSWRSVGVGLRLTMPDSLDAVETRGETEFTNLQVQLYGARWAVDVTYQNHQGMYLANSDELTVPVTSVRVPDLSLQTIGTTLMWSRNPRIDLATAYKLDAIPRRSRAGLVWMAAASRIRLDAPSGPGGTVPALDDTVWSRPMELQSHSVLAGIGGAATATRASFFVSPMVAMGLGLQHTGYHVGGDSGDRWAMVPQLSLRMSAGYNARRWYLALLVSADARNVQTPYLEATQGSARAELVFGRRYSLSRWRGTRGIQVR